MGAAKKHVSSFILGVSDEEKKFNNIWVRMVNQSRVPLSGVSIIKLDCNVAYALA
jgi:hypothetical protein